jgi:hypothetical protein
MGSASGYAGEGEEPILLFLGGLGQQGYGFSSLPALFSLGRFGTGSTGRELLSPFGGDSSPAAGWRLWCHRSQVTRNTAGKPAAAWYPGNGEKGNGKKGIQDNYSVGFPS